jgi:hypothetical protein
MDVTRPINFIMANPIPLIWSSTTDTNLNNAEDSDELLATLSHPNEATTHTPSNTTLMFKRCAWFIALAVASMYLLGYFCLDYLVDLTFGAAAWNRQMGKKFWRWLFGHDPKISSQGNTYIYVLNSFWSKTTVTNILENVAWWDLMSVKCWKLSEFASPRHYWVVCLTFLVRTVILFSLWWLQSILSTRPSQARQEFWHTKTKLPFDHVQSASELTSKISFAPNVSLPSLWVRNLNSISTGVVSQ